MLTFFEIFVYVRQILPMQVAIHRLMHIVGVGGALGVDVEHHEGRKAMTRGDALNGFDRVV